MNRRGTTTDADEFTLPLSLDEDRPKGDQLHAILLELIATLNAGDPVPSERRLAERYGVARMTVRGEIRKLAADGIVRILPGVGVVVADPAAGTFSTSRSLTRDLAGRGLEAGSIVQEHSVFRATSETAERLEVPLGSRALRVVQIRTADGVPTGIEQTTLPLERFAGLDQVDLDLRPLDRVLAERYGVRATSRQARVTAVRPTPEQAELLEIAAADPCLSVEAVLRDASGIVIEYSTCVYRGDRYDLTVNQRSSELGHFD